MSAYQRRVRTGGLFRCCVETAVEFDEPSEVGTVLDCIHEPEGNANLIVAADGVWEWNRA